MSKKYKNKLTLLSDCTKKPVLKESTYKQLNNLLESTYGLEEISYKSILKHVSKAGTPEQTIQSSKEKNSYNGKGNFLITKTRTDNYILSKIYTGPEFISTQEDGKVYFAEGKARIRDNNRYNSLNRVHSDELNKENSYIDKIQKERQYIYNLCEYIGKNRTIDNLLAVNGFIIDLDVVNEETLIQLMSDFESGKVIKPSVIAPSGSGLHLYYFLDSQITFRDWDKKVVFIRDKEGKVIFNKNTREPKKRIEKTKEIKKDILNRIYKALQFTFDKYCKKENGIDSLSVSQGFRVPGSIVKPCYGTGTISAYNYSLNRAYSLEDLIQAGIYSEEKPQPTKEDLEFLRRDISREEYAQNKIKWDEEVAKKGEERVKFERNLLLEKEVGRITEEQYQHKLARGPVEKEKKGRIYDFHNWEKFTEALLSIPKDINLQGIRYFTNLKATAALKHINKYYKDSTNITEQAIADFNNNLRAVLEQLGDNAYTTEDSSQAFSNGNLERMYGYLINTVAPEGYCSEERQAKKKNGAYSKLREYLIGELGEPKYIRDTRSDAQKEADRIAWRKKQGASQRLNRENKVKRAAELATHRINSKHSQAEVRNILFECGKSVGVAIRTSRDKEIINKEFDKKRIPNITFLQSEEKKLQKVAKAFTSNYISKDISLQVFYKLTNMTDSKEARMFKLELDTTKETFIDIFNRVKGKTTEELEDKLKEYIAKGQNALYKYPDNIQNLIKLAFDKQTTVEQLDEAIEFLSTLIISNLLKEDLFTGRTKVRTFEEIKEDNERTIMRGGNRSTLNLLMERFNGLSIINKEIIKDTTKVFSLKDLNNLKNSEKYKNELKRVAKEIISDNLGFFLPENVKNSPIPKINLDRIYLFKNKLKTLAYLGIIHLTKPEYYSSLEDLEDIKFSEMKVREFILRAIFKNNRAEKKNKKNISYVSNEKIKTQFKLLKKYSLEELMSLNSYIYMEIAEKIVEDHNLENIDTRLLAYYIQFSNVGQVIFKANSNQVYLIPSNIVDYLLSNKSKTKNIKSLLAMALNNAKLISFPQEREETSLSAKDILLKALKNTFLSKVKLVQNGQMDFKAAELLKKIQDYKNPKQEESIKKEYYIEDNESMLVTPVANFINDEELDEDYANFLIQKEVEEYLARQQYKVEEPEYYYDNNDEIEEELTSKDSEVDKDLEEPMNEVVPVSMSLEAKPEESTRLSSVEVSLNNYNNNNKQTKLITPLSKLEDFFQKLNELDKVKNFTQDKLSLAWEHISKLTEKAYGEYSSFQENLNSIRFKSSLAYKVVYGEKEFFNQERAAKEIINLQREQYILEQESKELEEPMDEVVPVSMSLEQAKLFVSQLNKKNSQVKLNNSSEYTPLNNNTNNKQYLDNLDLSNSNQYTTKNSINNSSNTNFEELDEDYANFLMQKEVEEYLARQQEQEEYYEELIDLDITSLDNLSLSNSKKNSTEYTLNNDNNNNYLDNQELDNSKNEYTLSNSYKNSLGNSSQAILVDEDITSLSNIRLSNSTKNSNENSIGNNLEEPMNEVVPVSMSLDNSNSKKNSTENSLGNSTTVLNNDNFLEEINLVSKEEETSKDSGFAEENTNGSLCDHHSAGPDHTQTVWTGQAQHFVSRLVPRNGILTEEDKSQDYSVEELVSPEKESLSSGDSSFSEKSSQETLVTPVALDNKELTNKEVYSSKLKELKSELDNEVDSFNYASDDNLVNENSSEFNKEKLDSLENEKSEEIDIAKTYAYCTDLGVEYPELTSEDIDYLVKEMESLTWLNGAVSEIEEDIAVLDESANTLKDLFSLIVELAVLDLDEASEDNFIYISILVTEENIAYASINYLTGECVGNGLFLKYESISKYIMPAHTLTTNIIRTNESAALSRLLWDTFFSIEKTIEKSLEDLIKLKEETLNRVAS